jgi:hypothetical protein
MFAGAIIASWLSVAAAVKANSTADGGAQAERRVRNANYMIDQCLAPAEALAQSVLANERTDDAGERACA